MKINRSEVIELEDLPNVGKAIAVDLRLTGIKEPERLRGKDPFALYEKLCKKTRMRHDPCVIDVFMSIVSFMNGGAARPWYKFTAERKKILALQETKQSTAKNSPGKFTRRTRTTKLRLA